jgi:hypothetical protein
MFLSILSTVLLLLALLQKRSVRPTQPLPDQWCTNRLNARSHGNLDKDSIRQCFHADVSIGSLGEDVTCTVASLAVPIRGAWMRRR